MTYPPVLVATRLCQTLRAGVTAVRHSTMIIVALLAALSLPAQADRIEIDVDIPALNTDPYHRPFIAAWIETPKRKGLATITVLYDDAEWLKDLRQWWRKQGRRMKSVDAVSGATRKPGTHRIQWSTSSLPIGEYVLCLEAAREAGGREFIRIPIQVGVSATSTHQAQGKHELGNITVRVSPE